MERVKHTLIRIDELLLHTFVLWCDVGGQVRIIYLESLAEHRGSHHACRW
jgi:hypothetical protein